MIVYAKSHVQVAELFFDEKEMAPKVDIVRYQGFGEPVEGSFAHALHTIQIDLSQQPEEILAAMNQTTRKRVRRAEREGLQYCFNSQPDDTCMQEFVDFFDHFAVLRGLPPVNRARLEGMRASGIADISCMRDPEGNALVWHCQFVMRSRACMIYTASLFREESDKERINMISRANTYLHFRDMIRFRERGCAVYDFGSWYEGDGDSQKLHINNFKEGFGGQVTVVYNTDRGVTSLGRLAILGRRLQRAWRRGK